jgi:hypothetical protein
MRAMEEVRGKANAALVGELVAKKVENAQQK